VTGQPYTDADVELLARAAYEEAEGSTPGGWYKPWVVAPKAVREGYVWEARAGLKALAAAGRLVPFDDDPRHVAEFRDEGWCIQHPLACRQNGGLFDCPFNRAALSLDTPPAQLGRFEVSLSDEGQGGDLVIGDRIETGAPS